MDLRRFLKQCLAGAETGQLVIKFGGERHLCKISIENGHAVYISLGAKSPEETIAYIRDKVPEEANFIAGIAPARKLDTPLDETLFGLPDVALRQPPLPDGADAGPLLSADKVHALVEHFVDIVGPLGAVLADEHMARLGYVRGADISTGTFSVLLKGLTEEVPDDRKAEFMDTHA